MLTQELIDKYKSDFELYSKENLFIIDKDSQLIPFVFNRMQSRLWKLLLEQLIRGIPIRLLIVKDRQIGCSSWICGLLFWLCSLFANKGALQVNYDADSAAGLFSKIKLFYKMLKPELKPLRKISNRQELYFANPDDDGTLGLESRIRIDTADSEELGVSFTLNFVHLSEMAIWEEKGFDIKKRMAALNQSIPNRKGTVIIIETTPRGEGYVKDMWDNEENGYTKIFISSVCSDDYRIELSPNDYFPLADYEEHRFGDETEEYFLYEEEVKRWYDFDIESKEGKEFLHHEVMCRLAWRRECILKTCEGDKKIFDREYPITIEKAFQSDASAVFDKKRLNEIKKTLQIIVPRFGRYAYYPDKGKYGDFYFASNGKLKVFYEPLHKKERFIIGGDGAQGIRGGDCSALSCRKLPDFQQVFTYSDIIDPFNFAKLVCFLAKKYNNAFVGLEVNDKGGFASVEYLLNYFHYTNQYRREVQLVIGDEETKKYGWVTSVKTKPIMVADYKEAIRTSEIELLDIELVEQLMAYKLLKKNVLGIEKKLTGAAGEDGLAIADMICLQMSQYVTIQPEIEPQKKKYTLKWWESLVDRELGSGWDS